jgi:F-type H+-transporting ATPase subunit delta
MDESKISVRYAKALLGLAREKQIVEAVRIDMQMIQQLFETMPGFNQMLVSPVISVKEKRILLEKVFASCTNALTYSFIMLLITNKREGYLSAITRNFNESCRKAEGYKAAKLISASAIDPSTVDQLRTMIRKHFNTEVDLTCTVDSKLIGGFVLQVEDQQIDASVAAKLKKLKNQLLASKK